MSLRYTQQSHVILVYLVISRIFVGNIRTFLTVISLVALLECSPKSVRLMALHLGYDMYYVVNKLISITNIVPLLATTYKIDAHKHLRHLDTHTTQRLFRSKQFVNEPCSGGRAVGSME